MLTMTQEPKGPHWLAVIEGIESPVPQILTSSAPPQRRPLTTHHNTPPVVYPESIDRFLDPPPPVLTEPHAAFLARWPKEVHALLV